MSVVNTHEGPGKIGSYMNEILHNGRSVFFIGVGGVMMSSLALLTKQAGYRVLGCDRTCTSVTATLEQAGICMFYSHSADNLPADCGLVVYTVAIAQDNPEYVSAQTHNIPCVSRADYLGWLMTGYRNRVGISGMHGKSTCTAMCARLFLEADADPTVLIGADYRPLGGAYRLGGRTHFIFEACEYMDSFLDFRPTVAVLLNAEEEHVDYFKSMAQIERSFGAFAGLTGQGGVTVVNADDEHVSLAAACALAEERTGRLITYGTQHPADFHASDIVLNEGMPGFTLTAFGEEWGRVQLSVPGAHQVYNALAAAAAGYACGVDRAAILTGLAHFEGVCRRMEYRGTVNGARVFDDYGHHPTEIRATLEGAAALCGTHEDGTPGMLICVFQPHTYSRTARLYQDFLHAFGAAAHLFLLDIYAARETDTLGVSSAGLARDLGGGAIFCPTPADAAAAVRNTARAGDIVVIMGAGDVTRVSGMLFQPA